ncbi:MAG TPA: alginate lyase family protein [Gemmatimonadaceae bacterium]
MRAVPRKSVLAFARRLRGRSPRELAERGAQFLASELECRGWSAAARVPDDAAFARLLYGSRESAMRGDSGARRRPLLFGGASEPAQTAAEFAVRFPDRVSGILAAADRVLAGRFDLLGYRDLSFGDPIDWHLDPVHARRAPAIHWSRIPYLAADLVGDHKIIWELNRQQHLLLLARAYLLSRDERYAAAAAGHVVSWMDSNPPKIGINWASSLEVAYRAIAWLWVLALLDASPSITPELRREMTKLLYVHGRHLERYLSRYFSPNTHLTGEALGLLYLGVALPQFRRARRWRDLGWRVLAAELPRQVLNDGVYFEQATYYQRYTVDIYLHAVLLARAKDLPVSSTMLDRLEKAAEHLAFLTRPDGLTPLVGDDDGGRLLPLDERECADFRSTLSTAGVVLGRGDMLEIAGGLADGTCWLLGAQGCRKADALPRTTPALQSRAFPEGGCVILRDGWTRNATYVAFDGGGHGALSGGHAHADALSIEVALRGRTVLVDPGTFAYTTSARERNHFRSTTAHNTITIDGTSWPTPGAPFQWQNRSDVRLEHWRFSPAIDQCTAVHTGIGGATSERIAHRRTVALVKEGGYLVVRDTLEAQHEHEVSVRFHFQPGTRVDETAENAVRIRTPDPDSDEEMQVELHFLGDLDRVECGSDWVSSCYGRREPAPVCTASARRTGRQELITVVIPSAGESINVSEELRGGARTVSIIRGDTEDALLVQDAGPEIITLVPRSAHVPGVSTAIHHAIQR